MEAVAARDLRKVFGKTVAVSGLTLTVQAGEVFGFLGPNGAGKTTTVKMLLGLVTPSAGTASLFGAPSSIPSTRRTVGYLPENFRFQNWLTGRELLEFHGSLAGMTNLALRRRIPEVLALVGLADRGGDRLGGYSKGMMQRIGLAQAILSNPRLVLLDEPTSALDPLGRREVRDIIRTLRAEGTTVFLNSHLLSEVELVCDRVAIVDRGEVVRSGAMEELLSGIAELRVTLDRVDAPILDALRAFGTVRAVERESIVLEVPDFDAAPAVAELAIRMGYRLFGLVPVHQSLEDLFVQLVEPHAG